MMKGKFERPSYTFKHSSFLSMTAQPSQAFSMQAISSLNFNGQLAMDHVLGMLSPASLVVVHLLSLELEQASPPHHTQASPCLSLAVKQALSLSRSWHPPNLILPRQLSPLSATSWLMPDSAAQAAPAVGPLCIATPSVTSSAAAETQRSTLVVRPHDDASALAPARSPVRALFAEPASSKRWSCTSASTSVGTPPATVEEGAAMAVEFGPLRCPRPPCEVGPASH
mmetsp:Transcript_60560/g.153227  ORF Transcript_60560/g.153227 Transcript_60560/m.153227 type:complete len:226 (-) Transcript_60560:13-690(-)